MQCFCFRREREGEKEEAGGWVCVGGVKCMAGLGFGGREVLVLNGEIQSLDLRGGSLGVDEGGGGGLRDSYMSGLDGCEVGMFVLK